MVKYFLEKSPMIEMGLIQIAAATSGNKELLNLLHTRSPLLPSKEFLAAIAQSGKIDLMDWAVSLGCPLSPDIYMVGPTIESVEVMNWAKDHGIELKEESHQMVIKLALSNEVYDDDIKIIKWLHDNGVDILGNPEDTAPWAWAIMARRFEIFKFAAKSGLKMSPHYYSASIRTKDEPFRRYLDELHCPFDIQSMYEAAAHYSGDALIALISELRSKGIAWDPMVAWKAITRGNLSDLKWLLKNGCPIDRNSLHNAFSRGDILIAAYLIDEVKLRPTPYFVAQVFASDKVKAIDFIIERKMAYDPKEAWVLATGTYRPHLLRKMLAIGFVFGAEHFLDSVMEQKDDVLRWLKLNVGTMVDLVEVSKLLVQEKVRASLKKSKFPSTLTSTLTWVEEMMLRQKTS